MIKTYTSLHVHSEYSNGLLQFTDSTIHIPQALQWCYDNGLCGMALSDHEGVSGFPEMEQAISKMNIEHPFQHIFANEIYLISEQENELAHSETERPYYWHFLLIALDDIGVHQLYELSSRAWLRSYMWHGLRRRPTFYSDIEEVIGNNKGHIIGSNACLGGRLPKYILANEKQEAIDFISWGKNTFGEDCFYLECQPCEEDNDEQLKVNKALWKLHEYTNTPVIVTTDAHYMTIDDRKIHTAFLNSKDGGDTREADKFYRCAHLYTPQELREALYISGFDDEQIDEMFGNTNAIADRVQPITLKKTTQVPALPEVPNYTIENCYQQYYEEFPYVKHYAKSKDPYEQYYFAQVEKGLKEQFNIHPEVDKHEYISQVNTEMEQVKGLGEIFDNQRMSDYFTVVQKVIDLIWTEGDSLVGIGRGSAGAYLTNKLLGITGIDPMQPEIKDFYPWWRFCSTARSDSIFDIDIDIESFKKEKIIQAIKDYFGWHRVCQCVTWGRLSSKTAIERAAKGLGISDDVAGYIKSLIPVKRGKIYSIKDCFEGNEDKGRERVPEFKTKITKYPDLLETALAFEGLIISSGVHAGALNVLKSDFTDTGALMVSSNGAVINQYDLHMGEFCGQLKFDLLSIDCLQNIRACMDLLIENGYMEDQGSLRNTYNHYLSYDNIEKENKEMWALLPTMSAAFQYDSRAGKEALRVIGANNIVDLTLANGLMRLQTADTEQPMQKYVRYRNNINEWYKDMTDYGLTQEEQEIYKDLLGKYSGLCISQETMMVCLMDERVCKFTLKEADKARKAVAKKSAEALQETEDRLYLKGAECGRSRKFLDYLWNVQIEMSKSYAFAASHAHEYSSECLQELNLYWKYPKVFWNTAVVTTQSQTADERENSAVAIDYGKIAQSIYKAKENGTEVKAPDINKSGLSFTPDVENDSILFGLGAIASINNAIANQIISNRPYTSFHSFYTKNTYDGSLITPSKFLMLIKSGCFDIFNPDRTRIMKEYIYYSTPQKKQLTMANFDEAVRIKCKFPKALLSPVNFKKYVTSKQFYYGQHPNFKSKKLYYLDDRALKYFNQNCKDSMQEGVDYWVDDDRMIIVDKSVEKLLKKPMDELKEYINTDDFLKEFNKKSMAARYDELCPNKDANMWSFESCSFFSQQNVFTPVDLDRYNITPFEELPEEPVFVDREFRGRSWKQYELSRIVIIVLSKNDNTHTVTGLDVHNNVVNIKFNSSEFAWYRQQISEQVDGSKVVRDKSWFGRGVCLIVTGYRNGNDSFKCKNYKSSIFPHKLQKIEYIDTETGELELMSNRYGYGDDEDE